VKSKPELLAPAGNIESFFAAVENGADAVYLGLKKFSARATAANFTLEDLATLVPFAHKRNVRVYAALNSLIAASEIPEVLDSLNALSSINADALIVQDAGLFFLVRRYFPALKLHASTLMTAHNSAGVNTLERMGAERVVLARELSMPEIEKVCANTKVDLEIFVHGALCYSYSGLCLASSFRGGRSGLRGECVQPCRLKYSQGKKQGFFLSCNDLCALPLIPQLKQLRISCFKIEGRMKPAAYIAQVVQAYRGVLDADPGEDELIAVRNGYTLLGEAPSRQLTSGYFSKEKSGAVLTPHRSGSSGILAGTVNSFKDNRILVALRRTVEKGDRLRPESTGGQEEEAFTVSDIFDLEGKQVPFGETGLRVFLACPRAIPTGAKLFKVGEKSEPPASIWKKIRKEVPSGVRYKAKFPAFNKVRDSLRREQREESKEREHVIIKIGSTNDLINALQSSAGTVLLSATRTNLERIAKQRFSPLQMRKLGFSLPPLISEHKDIDYYRAALTWFLGKGFRLWEVNNWGHFDLLKESRDLRIIAGARLNLRNSAALAQVHDMGCIRSVLSLEITKEEIQLLAQEALGWNPVINIYSWPPVFTSRLIPNLAEEKPFLTPRSEMYHLKKQAGNGCIYADRPISWCEQIPFLRSLGFRNFLLDVSDGPEKHTQNPARILSSFASFRSPGPFSVFNFDHRA
jgi:U32 family peptidase